MKTMTPSRDLSGGMGSPGFDAAETVLWSLSQDRRPRTACMTGQQNLMVSCWASSDGGRGSSTVD